MSAVLCVSTTAHNNPALGIVLMTTGTLLLTLQDGVSKWLIEDYSVGEILFYRGLWAYVPIAFFAWRSGGWHVLRSARPTVNVVRACLNSCAGLAIISAYAFMPLATAMAIMFASPILVTALSVSLLGEPVGRWRWFAVLLGFIGVMLILQPEHGVWEWFLLLPLLAAVLIAMRDVLTRKLGAVDDPTAILFYTVTASVAFGALWMAVYGASWPSSQAWAVFVALGLLNGVAHFATIKAFTVARAATLMPLRYLSLVWAGLIGFMVWGDVPTTLALAGAVLVVASGLVIVLRERQQANA
jgi:drug/metabolite transporter (DMT)-like permease